MKAFRDLVLAEAIGLRSEEAPAPSWLRAAQEALAEFASGPADKEQAMAFAQRLSEIEEWPKGADELREQLDARAEPIERLLSQAFCSIGQDDAGRPKATLWGGEGSVIIDSGRVLTEASPGSASRTLGSRAASDVFQTSDWESPDHAAQHFMMGPPGQGKSAALRAAAARSRGALAELQRLTGDPSQRPADFSETVRSAVFGGAPDSAERLSAIGFLIDMERSERILEATREKFRRALAANTQNGFTDFMAMHEAIHSRLGRRPELSELAEETSEALGGAAEEIQESPFDEKSAMGIERASQLSEALKEAGPRALGRARADAAARLVALLERQAPESLAAASAASVIWGLPLSLSASESAREWAPVASRLLKEDPRRGALALAMAPALGLGPNDDLLSQVKSRLKAMGWSEGLWKSVGGLTQEAFDSLLNGFRQGDREIGEARKKADSRFSSLTGGFMALPSDPFGRGGGDDKSEDAMRGTAAQVALAAQAASIAGVSISEALSFCSSNGALNSKAWASPVERPKRGELENVVMMDDFLDGMGIFGRAVGRGGHHFVGFCVAAGTLLNLPGAVGAEGEMMKAEREAMAAKAPRVLALAMKEARSRSSKVRDVFAEFDDLNDWFKRSEPGLWQQLPENMTWASLRRREQAWHKELQAAKDAEFQKPWEKMLDEPVAIEGRVARELESGAALFEEGKAMRHCVSSYA